MCCTGEGGGIMTCCRAKQMNALKFERKPNIILDEGFAEKLTAAFGESVRLAIAEHLAAGRPVYGVDREGRIIKKVR